MITDKKNFNRYDDMVITQSIIAVVEKRISKRRTLQNRFKAGSYIFVTIMALAACIPTVISFYAQFSSSGATNYLSLLTSDTSFFFSHWKEFIISISTSIPLSGVVAILALVFVFTYCLRQGSVYLSKLSINKPLKIIKI